MSAAGSAIAARIIGQTSEIQVLFVKICHYTERSSALLIGEKRRDSGWGPKVNRLTETIVPWLKNYSSRAYL